MRGRWIVLLTLPQCVAAAPDALRIAAAHALSENCALHADANDRGIAALGAACPGIESAAADLGLDRFLPRDWKSLVTARTFEELASLAQRYAVAAPSTTPDVSQLHAIGKGMAPPAEPLSLWERLKSSIDRWLEANNTTWPNWLRPHWSPSSAFWNALGYGLAVSIVLAALAVIVIEVRGARARDGRRVRGVLLPAAASSGAAPDPWPEFGAVEAASLREQAVLVLRLLVGALTSARRLDRERSLTCRELITAARFDSAAQREEFREVALLAERALYADSSSAPPATGLARVRRLYEALIATSDAARPGQL